jgi:Domain of unknown function (DUF4405)
MSDNGTPPNRNRTNLLVDIALFTAVMVAMAPHFSGVAIHEWLSIALGAAIITHLLLHWQWIVEVTRRLFRGAQASARVNYVLNTVLFVDMTVIIFTGLMISRVVLPLIAIQTAPGGVWRQLHSLSADAFLFLLGLHIALHWSWIVNTVKRLFGGTSSTARRESVAVEGEA